MCLLIPGFFCHLSFEDLWQKTPFETWKREEELEIVIELRLCEVKVVMQIATSFIFKLTEGYTPKMMKKT